MPSERPPRSRVTGRELAKVWGVNVRHALYSESGKWYHQLVRFPGALFDSCGYVVFETESAFRSCAGLQINQDVFAPDGIRRIADYVSVRQVDEASPRPPPSEFDDDPSISESEGATPVLRLQESSPEDHPRPGRGFGTPEENKLVEIAAVNAVTADYALRGWRVQSVEHEGCGYDLVCGSGESVEHVEVKGVSGNVQQFVITEGEVRQARGNPRFVLYVVTTARTRPVLTRYKGSDFLGLFRLTPLAHRAIIAGESAASEIDGALEGRRNGGSNEQS